MTALNTKYNSNLGRLARSLRLGRVLYQLYYLPKGGLTKLYQEGLLQIALTRYGRREMERSTLQLPPLKMAKSENPFEVVFLSGRRFWYQTCYCAYSLIKYAQADVRPVIYDDGTLNEEYSDKIMAVLPQCRIITARDIRERLDETLPMSKFPTLRQRRIDYVHLRKLTDVHAGSEGWKLVLDSDMLFFRRPALLLDWLECPETPVYMVDVDSAYGYSDGLMSSLAKASIPERVNVGVCGLKSEDIDWEQLENWCRIMLEREGSSYYQEQALTAMLLAKSPCLIAPAADYIIKPDLNVVLGGRGVMHHYVAESKVWYFRHAWKKALLGMVPARPE